MEKNAEFIRTKEFHIVFKGYKTEEVDKFLDIVSVEFDRLIKKNRELQDNLDKIKYENNKEQEEDSDIKKIIQDALVSAHKVAEDIKGQANREAEEMLAKRKEEEQDVIKSMETKKVEMEESIITVQNKYSEFKEKIRQMSEQLYELVNEVEAGFVLQEEPQGEQIQEEPQGEQIQEEPQGEQIQETTPEELEEESSAPAVQEFGEPVSQAQKLDETEEKNDDFEGYGIINKRQDGFYFDKKKEPATKMTSENIQEQSEEGPTDQTVQTDIPQVPEQTDTSVASELADAPEFTKKTPEPEEEKKEEMKERKKIDIANPDIIESFFKASDD